MTDKGEVDDNVAVPPDKERIKSELFKISDVAAVELNTGSLNVIVIVTLSEVIELALICGGVLFNNTVLEFCEVGTGFPAISIK